MGYKNSNLQNLVSSSVKKVNSALSSLNTKFLKRKNVALLQKPATYNYSLSTETRLAHDNSTNRVAFGSHLYNR